MWNVTFNARRLRLNEVPVIVLEDLSEIERRQLVLADNRIALNAGWDTEMFSLELRDLSDLGADLSALGFTKAELATALNGSTAGLTDEDEVPEVGEVAVTRPGDIWIIGKYRFRCGDCTDPDAVAAPPAEQRELFEQGTY